MAADTTMTGAAVSEVELRRRIEVDPDDAASLDALGLLLRDAGQGNAALDCFKKAVMAAPDHVEAQLHMAETLLDLDQFAAAATAYRRLTILIPDFAPIHTALGVALKRGDDVAAAMACYQQAMALDPEDPAPVFNLALALEEAAKSEEAIAAYETVTSIAPEMLEAWVNLGNLHHREKRFAAAAEAYERALVVNPKDASTWSRLGVVADALGARDEARAHYRMALEIDPECVAAHYNLGISLREEGDLAAAIHSYRQALAADPARAEVLYNLGLAQQADGDAAAAETSYRAAISVDADQVAAQNNLGTALLDQGQLVEAVDAYRQAAGDDPATAVHANSAWNLSVALLLSGDYEEGWRWYEWRFHKGGATPPSFEKPRWHLDAPADARVLVWAEQGYGDTMQFVRYVPMVKSHAAAVILDIQPNLRRLLDGFGGAVTVAPGEEMPEYDFHIPMLSLPGLFGTTVDSVPADIPYLSGDPQRVVYWRERLAGDGRAIGLSWRGNPENQNDRYRSVDPILLGPLLNSPGCRFFSLQKVPATGDWDVLANLGPITDLGPELGDFSETAAVIEALDLVITVDTATAHLAGGLGKLSWLMLPFIPDWRWMLDTDESPWYPCLRLFRQRELDSWRTVIERMTAALHDGT